MIEDFWVIEYVITTKQYNFWVDGLTKNNRGVSAQCYKDNIYGLRTVEWIIGAVLISYCHYIIAIIQLFTLLLQERTKVN